MITVKLHTYVINQNRDAFPITREFTLPETPGARYTISDFFHLQFLGRDADNYLISVNKRSVPATYVLKHRDEISVIPNNLETKSTLTVSGSGTVSFSSFDFENEVDPMLLELEEKVKKLME
jgi:sulfur carrier protein ThiS